MPDPEKTREQLLEELDALQARMSQLHQEADRLRQGEARFRSLFDSRMLGLVFWDADGRITDANDIFLQAVGYARDDLLAGAVRWPDMTPAEHQPLARRAVQDIQATGACTPFETEWVRSDGTRMPALVGGAAQPGTTGGGVAFSLDLAGHRREQQGRRQAEERLRRRHTMQALARMAGGVAHHVNNLLAVINGYGDLLLSALPAADPLRPDAEAIRRAGDRAAALTRELLAFAGKQFLRPQALDLNGLVAGRADTLRRLLGAGIELVTDLAPSLGRVMADPGQMEQVLTDLAANARDALPHGGRLTVATSNIDLDESLPCPDPEARPGPYVLLTVTDTGRGLDEAVRDRVFEPFLSTEGAGKGTGLRLAAVYGIIRQSGGHIAVHSEPGRGSAFRVHLPRLGEAVPGARTGPARPKSSRAPETVLLVEDEEMVRTLAATILRQRYTVLEAGGGDEALRLAQRYAGPIHLLVSDVRLPGMSGPQLVELLRPSRPGLKALFISGYPDDALLPQRLSEPGTGFLPKPFSPQALAQAVRELLGQ